MTEVTYKTGTIQNTTTITGEREWTGGPNQRIYYDHETLDPRKGIYTLYRVIAGSTRDHRVEVNGSTFGYRWGVHCDSKTKRESVKQAVIELAQSLTEEEHEHC